MSPGLSRSLCDAEEEEEQAFQLVGVAVQMERYAC